MGKKKKVIFVLILIILILLAAFFAYRKISENRMAEKQQNLFGVKWPTHSIWLHDDKMDEVIQLIGEPNQTDSDDPDRVLLQYNGFQVLCTRSGNQTAPYFGAVVISDPDFTLWRGNIHVGSTRAEVEKAFQGLKYEAGDYRDLYWTVGFIYDENDCVKAIHLA